MRKVLFSVIAIWFLCIGITWANPYLCCDPMTTEVNQVDVELNGQLFQVPRANIVIASDGSWCLIDLNTIAEGNYLAKAMAYYDVWGASPWSADFLFVKPAIVEPANIMLKVSP